MNATTRWGFVLFLLPLAACGPDRPTQMAVTAPQPPSMPSAQDQNFVQAAAASDQFEIKSSALAVQKSRTPAVRTFAQKMIDDHTQSTKTLTGIVGPKGIQPSPTLDTQQLQMLSGLQRASGRAFDRDYWRAQVNAHKATATAFQAEINGGYDSDIQRFAQQTLPTVQNHLEEAQQAGGR
ncbi:MAG: DUF4142 domain-containing protein [Acetobacteraceae bacterium]